MVFLQDFDYLFLVHIISVYLDGKYKWKLRECEPCEVYCVKILLILSDTMETANFLALKHENYGNLFSLSPFQSNVIVMLMDIVCAWYEGAQRRDTGYLFTTN